MTSVGFVSKVFYANHGPIINRGKIKESCEEFLQEVRKNYDGFKTQVEIHCLECVEDLASLVLKLMRVNDEVYDGLVAKFPGAAKGDEEGKELSEKLSRESAVLEERKEFLKKTGSVSGEEIGFGVICEECRKRRRERVIQR